MATCTAVVMEAKRVVPLVPLVFGRARWTFACDGYEVPEGWRVYPALHLVNRDLSIYAEPERFDPDRFGPGREEHRKDPLAFTRRDLTRRRAIGASDWSTRRSLRSRSSPSSFAGMTGGCRQRLDLDWPKRPPEPSDGLTVQLRPV